MTSPMGRRSFLNAGFLALGGLGLNDLFRLRSAAAAGLSSAGFSRPSAATPDTSVILIWLQGGPSHLETYNFREGATFPVKEAPGISVFAKDDDGRVFHTYSAYARGLENFIGAYHLLDIVPKGRDEGEFSYGMEWLRHKDRYGDESFVDPYSKS